MMQGHVKALVKINEPSPSCSCQSSADAKVLVLNIEGSETKFEILNGKKTLYEV
jgi:hypothetical protein